MNKHLIFILLFGLFFTCSKNDFLGEQKKYERVRVAIAEKESSIKLELEKNKIELKNLHIILVAYKSEGILDLYAKNKSQSTYKKIKSFAVCASSGTLGPKRKKGDGQVPEGFYHIDRFNPTSSYYLSLGLNYPNSADRKASSAIDLGGDIFIHGSCVTIGCLPMTDDKIKEIYVYSIHAKNNGQERIPVYIFPFKMDDFNYLVNKKYYEGNKSLISFWSKLKVGYDSFINESKELNFKIDEKGNYTF
jgi:murein L,D-transpeptidase YafK